MRREKKKIIIFLKKKKKKTPLLLDYTTHFTYILFTQKRLEAKKVLAASSAPLALLPPLPPLLPPPPQIISTKSTTPVYDTQGSCSDSGMSADEEPRPRFDTHCKEGAYPISQIPFIDSHCHIDYIFVREKHYGSFNSFIKRKEFPQNFSGCIANFCDPPAWGNHKMYDSLLEEDGVWGAFGERHLQISYIS